MSLTQIAKACERINGLVALTPENEREAVFYAEIRKLPEEAKKIAAPLVSACNQFIVLKHRSINVTMSETKNIQNFSGGTFNAPVAINQAFSNCFNTASGVADSDLGAKLKTLIGEIQTLHPELPIGEGEKVERRLKNLTDEAASKNPDKDQLALSGKGLIEAAKTCAKMAAPITIAVKAVLAFFGVPIP